MNELAELQEIIDNEEQDWEASRLAEVVVDIVRSREEGELTEAEYIELLGDIRQTELIFEEAEATEMKQKLVKVVETLAKFIQKMPVKFGKSVAIRNRETGKVTIQHEYMHEKSNKELLEAYEKINTTPKLRRKIKNELVARKILK